MAGPLSSRSTARPATSWEQASRDERRTLLDILELIQQDPYADGSSKFHSTHEGEPCTAYVDDDFIVVYRLVRQLGFARSGHVRIEILAIEPTGQRNQTRPRQQ